MCELPPAHCVSVGPAGPHWSIDLLVQILDDLDAFQLDQLVLIGPSSVPPKLTPRTHTVSVGPAGPHWSIPRDCSLSLTQLSVSVGPAGPHWSIQVDQVITILFLFQLDQLVLIGPSRQLRHAGHPRRRRHWFQLDQLVLIGPSDPDKKGEKVEKEGVSVGPAGPHWSITGDQYKRFTTSWVSVGPAGPHWSILTNSPTAPIRGVSVGPAGPHWSIS